MEVGITGRGEHGQRRELCGLLWERGPEHRWVLWWLTARAHEDVTGKLQETQNLNSAQVAASQMWRHRARTGTCPSFMPNLKLTGRTVEFFWSGCQAVSRLLTTCDLLPHHPARSERSKFVRWNVSSFPLFLNASLRSVLFLPLSFFVAPV